MYLYNVTHLMTGFRPTSGKRQTLLRAWVKETFGARADLIYSMTDCIWMINLPKEEDYSAFVLAIGNTPESLDTFLSK